MGTVTDVGDAAVTMAVAAMLLLCFLWSSRPTALRWLWAVVACGGLTVALKLAFYLHGAPLGPAWPTSPSGHVAASVLVYGLLPVVGPAPRRRWAVVASAVVALVAVSRVYLHFHSESDVVAGACIGGACLAWFLAGRGDGRAIGPLHAGAPLAVTTCLLGVASGVHLHLDRMLKALAAYLGS